MSAVVRMEPEAFGHVPVLLKDVLRWAREGAPGLIVDCTLGGAGHASALLEEFEGATLVGLDRDEQALEAARTRLKKFRKRVRTEHAPFSELPRLVREGVVPKANVLLADLGVSSYQLDTAQRGFSFRADGPLDMRMDPSTGVSARELIELSDETTLADMIKRYGEERHARRVARAIKEAMPTTTGELADTVRKVVRKAKDGIDPATRTFQGLRIAVNGELNQLDALLSSLPDVLEDGGVALIISFHSLEDRAVKRTMRRLARHAPPGPGGLPPPVEIEPTLELLVSKPVVADKAEARENPRARSAKLRVARRLPRSQTDGGTL